jgi:hypothetical protein
MKTQENCAEVKLRKPECQESELWQRTQKRNEIDELNHHPAQRISNKKGKEIWHKDLLRPATIPSHSSRKQKETF